MNFETVLNRLIEDTTQSSLGCFAPEIALCATIVALLFVRLFNADRWAPPYCVAVTGSFVALLLTIAQFAYLRPGGVESAWWGVQIIAGPLLGLMNFDAASAGDMVGPIFTGLLVFDSFGVFFRLFLLFFLIMVIALTRLSGIPDDEDGPDFYTLLLGSTVGMMLMVGANHLLIFFLGVEMTSVPSYVLVGFLKGRRLSSEASLKYVVYGAGAAGVMLYGISLLAGLLGTASMPELAARLNLLVAGDVGVSDATVATVVLATLMILVGLAFKLSVVPFHFWCPDAFEGAAAEVGGFLSVASKAAAFALLVRFCLALVGDQAGALANINVSLGIGVGVIAAVTATFGNLAAYAQTNVKRLLAYSTIAHAGYMLMAVGALMVIVNAPAGTRLDIPSAAARSVEGLLYYLAVYLFMNLGAFAIVALIRNQIFSEDIDDYAGLSQETPVLCVCMGICMFSLIGLPPFGGFFAKLMIFGSLLQAGWVHWSMWAILGIGGLNTVFSLFYYLRVLRAMFLTARPDGSPSAAVSAGSPAGLYVLVISLPVLALGVFANPFSRTANDVATVILPFLGQL